MEEGLLEGRSAIVTGAGGGIGRATARLFAAHGARVSALDRDEESGQATAAAIHEAGGEAAFLRTDVTQPAEVEAAVEEVVDRFGQPDALVNVVGVSGRRWGDGPAHECTEEAWDKLMDINLKSVFLCCRQAIPPMLEAGGGAVVNVSSVLGLVGGGEDFATHAYAATKGGIISLTRAMATYYAPRGLRVNAVCPGLIATPMSERAQNDPDIQERLPELQPLTGDFGRPEDVAWAALYLASEKAGFVTGTVLPIDGGWTAK